MKEVLRALAAATGGGLFVALVVGLGACDARTGVVIWAAVTAAQAAIEGWQWWVTRKE